MEGKRPVRLTAHRPSFFHPRSIAGRDSRASRNRAVHSDESWSAGATAISFPSTVTRPACSSSSGEASCSRRMYRPASGIDKRTRQQHLGAIGRQQSEAETTVVAEADEAGALLPGLLAGRLILRHGDAQIAQANGLAQFGHKRRGQLARLRRAGLQHFFDATGVGHQVEVLFAHRRQQLFQMVQQELLGIAQPMPLPAACGTRRTEPASRKRGRS